MSANVAPVSTLQRSHHRFGANVAKTGLSMALLVVMAVYFLFPLYWLLIATTKTTTQLFNSSMAETTVPFSLGANLHWVATYQGGVFWRWFLNSVLYSGVTGVVSTLICAMAGYAIAKYSFRMQGTMQRMVIGALAVPGAALVIPVFLIDKTLGLINTYVGVLLPMLVNPFGVYFLSTYIREAMPSELIDSGRVDGANDFQIFFKIALEIIRPGLVTLFLISFIGTWNNFFLPLVLLNNSNLYPLTLGLDVWVANLNSAGTGVPLYPLIMIGSAISILPMVILFPFLRRYIVSGIAMGGVKM